MQKFGTFFRATRYIHIIIVPLTYSTVFDVCQPMSTRCHRHVVSTMTEMTFGIRRVTTQCILVESETFNTQLAIAYKVQRLPLIGPINGRRAYRRNSRSVMRDGVLVTFSRDLRLRRLAPAIIPSATRMRPSSPWINCTRHKPMA